MTLAIDADCALAYWMSADAKAISTKRRSCETLLERLEAGNLPSWAFTPDGEASALVTKVSERVHREGVICRQGTALPLGGSCAVAEGGTPLVSPECCFLRLAISLTLPELAKAGMLLTSSIAFDSSGIMVGRPPITTPKAISAFLGRASSAKGVKKARKALRFIVGNAASPPEIDACLLLCLPPLQGGYGCPAPELNGHVRLDVRATRSLGYADCYCDLLWRDAKCAVEYTSEQFHTGYGKQAEDEIRRTALESMGYRVFLLTKPQLYGQAPFEGIARSVLRTLGKRMPKQTVEFQSKQYELRKRLLYEPSWIIENACSPHDV